MSNKQRFAWVEGRKGEELIVPNGLPTENDNQKKVLSTDNTVAKDELTEHLGH